MSLLNNSNQVNRNRSPSSMIDVWENDKNSNLKRPTPITMTCNDNNNDEYNCYTDKEDNYSPDSYFTPSTKDPISNDDHNEYDYFHRYSTSEGSSGNISRAPSSDSNEVLHSYNYPYAMCQSASVVQSVPQTPPLHQVQKCRQLPCRTFISTGSCPYGDRCVFLHDARITSKPVYVRSKRKTKDDTTVDAFFWPTMPLHTVMGVLDNRNQPHIAQPYVVPVPVGHSSAAINGNGNNSNNNNNYNETAVYSMWEHFLDFLKVDSLSVVTVPRVVPTTDEYNPINPHTGKSRLPVLMYLSQCNNNN